MKLSSQIDETKLLELVNAAREGIKGLSKKAGEVIVGLKKKNL